jgi:hypothetical protein
MSTGGEVANALVCKTSIRRFNSGPVLQHFKDLCGSSLPRLHHSKCHPMLCLTGISTVIEQSKIQLSISQHLTCQRSAGRSGFMP